MTTQLSPALLTDLTTLAATVSRSAGELIVRLRAEGITVADTKSSAVDVVTEADRQAEAFIVDALRSARPHDGIFAEEGHSHESETGITWVIDPIDGTVNYLYGIPAFCVSIAATVAAPEPASTPTPERRRLQHPETDAPVAYADGRAPVAAAVFNPVTQEMFTAALGQGAQRNGEPITVSSERDLSRSLVATGFGYTEERRTHQATVLQHLITHVRDIRRIGSAAYDLCLVASGTIDAYYEIGIQPWDWAAGALVATEAGALTLGRADSPRAGSPMFIAGPEALASELQRRISLA